MRRAVLAAAVLAGSASTSWAQTNDHRYRSWRWTPSLGSRRAAGLAGSFVAVADDAAAAFLSPAGLATLPKSEVGGAALAATAGSVGPDRAKTWSGIGYLAGGGRLSRRLSIGGYLTQVRGGGLELSSAFVLPDNSRVSGYLDASIIEGGGAAAYKLTRRLNLGLRVTGTHLNLQGLYPVPLDAECGVDLPVCGHCERRIAGSRLLGVDCLGFYAAVTADEPRGLRPEGRQWQRCTTTFGYLVLSDDSLKIAVPRDCSPIESIETS